MVRGVPIVLAARVAEDAGRAEDDAGARLGSERRQLRQDARIALGIERERVLRPHHEVGTLRERAPREVAVEEECPITRGALPRRDERRVALHECDGVRRRRVGLGADRREPRPSIEADGPDHRERHRERRERAVRPEHAKIAGSEKQRHVHQRDQERHAVRAGDVGDLHERRDRPLRHRQQPPGQARQHAGLRELVRDPERGDADERRPPAVEQERPRADAGEPDVGRDVEHAGREEEREAHEPAGREVRLYRADQPGRDAAEIREPVEQAGAEGAPCAVPTDRDEQRNQRDPREQRPAVGRQRGGIEPAPEHDRRGMAGRDEPIRARRRRRHPRQPTPRRTARSVRTPRRSRARIRRPGLRP